MRSSTSEDLLNNTRDMTSLSDEAAHGVHQLDASLHSHTAQPGQRTDTPVIQYWRVYSNNIIFKKFIKFSQFKIEGSGYLVAVGLITELTILNKILGSLTC